MMMYIMYHVNLGWGDEKGGFGWRARVGKGFAVQPLAHDQWHMRCNQAVDLLMSISVASMYVA